MPAMLSPVAFAEWLVVGMLQVRLGIQVHLEQVQVHLACRERMQGLVLSPDGRSFAGVYAGIGLLVIRSTTSLEEASRIQLDISDHVINHTHTH